MSTYKLFLSKQTKHFSGGHMLTQLISITAKQLPSSISTELIKRGRKMIDTSSKRDPLTDAFGFSGNDHDYVITWCYRQQHFIYFIDRENRKWGRSVDKRYTVDEILRGGSEHLYWSIPWKPGAKQSTTLQMSLCLTCMHAACYIQNK